MLEKLAFALNLCYIFYRIEDYFQAMFVLFCFEFPLINFAKFSDFSFTASMKLKIYFLFSGQNDRRTGYFTFKNTTAPSVAIQCMSP